MKKATPSTALRSRFQCALGRFKVVWSDPALRSRWLRDTRKTQWVLVIMLFFGVFALPPAADAIGDSVFPPKKIGSFFRKRTKRQSASETIAISLTALFWAGVAVGTAKKAYQKLPAGPPGVPPRTDATSVMDSRDEAALSTEALAETVAVSASEHALDASPQPASTSRADAQQGAISISSMSKNRYVVEHELGRGGMGVVYEALDSVLERKVALKALSLSPAGMETTISRFRQEARVLASLTHPNIVQIYDLIETDEGLYIAMELVRGMNLADHLKQLGPMSPEEATQLCVPLAEAMAYAHDRGVLHRDLKPHNILLTKDLVPKITDFGLAIADESSHLTKTGVLMGSPAYMSPEQGSGKPLGPESDVYSFGITLFEILSGRPPFTGGFLKIALAKASQPPPPLRQFVPHIPAYLDQLIAKMLVSEPRQRISSMKSVAEQLRAAS